MAGWLDKRALRLQDLCFLEEVVWACGDWKSGWDTKGGGYLINGNEFCPLNAYRYEQGFDDISAHLVRPPTIRGLVMAAADNRLRDLVNHRHAFWLRAWMLSRLVPGGLEREVGNA